MVQTKPEDQTNATTSFYVHQRSITILIVTSFIPLNDTDLWINSSLAQDRLDLFTSLVIKVKHQLVVITMSQAIIAFADEKAM